MDFKGLMQKKVMGIPVLYVAGLLVAILAVVAWRMKPAAEPVEAVAGEDPYATDPEGALEGSAPVYVANPSAPGYGGGGSTPTPAEPVEPTNEVWARYAIEWLAAEGHATADQASIAIDKYLAGEQLSIAEGRLRDLAISHFGLPPDRPTSGGTESPDPVTPTPSTPTPKKYIAPGFHTVTGSSDDSYTDMARLFYGRTDNAAIDLIQSYNVSQGHQGPFKPGTRFWIPKYAAPKYVKATSTMRTAAQIIAKNPPLNSVKMLQELNDGMKFPVAVGTKVRVA